ncbi:MAG: 2-oxoacid:acceptor oxidoreductase subunit alpha [Candidatus Obscuribacterales bacterium]|nr:2-oxoacid:acceptor oxidoreductase subunit alpha [Candidatus Obscuribacterales bacterium]
MNAQGQTGDTGTPGIPGETPPPEPVIGKSDKKRPAIVNDFSIHVATVNGSGSQSANNILMRSIFQMGIPVSGKNLFPSNIQGLPTWFTIRVNKDGWVARTHEVQILVAMNPATQVDDVRRLPAGAVCFSPSDSGVEKLRTDITHYQVPFKELAAKTTDAAKIRKLIENMIYVGVVGHILDIDVAEIEKAIRKQFADKPKAAELNIKAAANGREWAQANLTKLDSFKVERLDKTAGKVIIDGNSASAIGCMFAGVTVLTWYPITPSSGIGEGLTHYLTEHRVKDGKPTFAVVQAEDELAAMGMALGAGWAGARAMTCTSGPGISLMAEFAGLGYFAEIPAVIFDVMRVGPSTGLPTRTSQADLSFVYQLSHGDTKHIVLLPGSAEECYSLAMQAFDLAERFQTPVFVLSDLDLGMNNWMADPFPYPEKPLDRGKVLSAEDLARLGKFERYRDVDGDGIPYRTLPGTNHPLAGYFTRGTGHNEAAGYTEKPGDYVRLMDRLNLKYRTARAQVPQPIVSTTDGAKVGIIAFGSSHFAVEESQAQLATEATLPTSYLRLRALPFTDDLRKFVESHDRVYIVEQNRDGQLHDLILAELPDLSSRLRSVLHYDGLPIDARSITNDIVAQEGGK